MLTSLYTYVCEPGY